MVDIQKADACSPCTPCFKIKEASIVTSEDKIKIENLSNFFFCILKKKQTKKNVGESVNQKIKRSHPSKKKRSILRWHVLQKMLKIILENSEISIMSMQQQEFSELTCSWALSWNDPIVVASLTIVSLLINWIFLMISYVTCILLLAKWLYAWEWFVSIMISFNSQRFYHNNATENLTKLLTYHHFC